jgi:hypothetical protein
MPHLDEGRIHEFLDGELEPVEVREIGQHLATCEDCAQRLQEARRLLGESDQLITLLDAPAREAPPRTVHGPTIRRLSRFRQWAWAASVILAAGLGYYGSTLRQNRSAATALEDQTPVASLPSIQSLDRESTAVQAAPAPGRPQRESQAKPPKSTVVEAKPAQPSEPAAGRRDEPAPAAYDRLNAVSGETEEARKAVGPPPAAPAGTVAGTTGAQAPASVAGGQLGLRAKVSKDERLQPTTMDDAVRQLSGAIRLIDGLQPSRVLTVPGPVGNEGDATAGAMVRVVYPDEPGREIWLDQQRLGVSNNLDMLAGDTLSTQAADGVGSLRWIDPTGFLLTLTGHVGVDSLRVLARHVR